jgi:hypothetical protein
MLYFPPLHRLSPLPQSSVGGGDSEGRGKKRMQGGTRRKTGNINTESIVENRRALV